MCRCKRNNATQNRTLTSAPTITNGVQLGLLETVTIVPGGLFIPIPAKYYGVFAGQTVTRGSGKFYVITSHNQMVTVAQKNALMEIWPGGFASVV